MTLVLKHSKPIEQIKKGDKMAINGMNLEVDAHYVLIEHGANKEMAIELFDSKAKEDEGDYQIRYFNDQAEDTIRFFTLKQILYQELEIEEIRW